ncbi:hypothetical protein QBC34DRAFT_380006 [Podospora aff. communis PSN243]|uniref:tyrosinase n=1 Tax=Podospora aff. communis PSN243 TaxID=3040156 RepID=A0AAV9GMH2_9PEZI|nr:hypothetical protein QBC34DRAFT_380006 [Podospora aff. communis PSN243]
MVRSRPSLQSVVNKYDTKEDPSILENLIRAFRKIQQLPPDHPDSFFTIAGYHGEPFVSEDPTNDNWWGGFCQHRTVLFPTWHRAYVLRIESALRNAMPEADISLPFWDECLTYGSSDNPIPWVLTAPKFPLLDGDDSNPLYSYTLQQDIADNHTTVDAKRYSKPAGYTTVRYPLSGLVGNEVDKQETDVQNAKYPDPVANAQILNNNVKAWLDGTVQIEPDGSPDSVIPDTFSAYSRYRISLDAPNYTVFSNKASMAQWITDNDEKPHYGVALEEGHNALHLSLGGFYQYNDYNADPIRGANGDMGENETSAFDPIFYFHHAFVDYVFWTWQRRHSKTARGSLTIDKRINGEDYDGTKSSGNPVFPNDTKLDMQSPLAPFINPVTHKPFTSEEITDIENIDGGLGYVYEPGSFDNIVDAVTGAGQLEKATPPLVTVAHVSNISRADHAGSFVIRTTVELDDGKEVEIGREAVLSRWHVSGCGNCRNNLQEHSFVAIDDKLLKALGLSEEDLKTPGRLKTSINARPDVAGEHKPKRVTGGDGEGDEVRQRVPKIEFL